MTDPGYAAGGPDPRAKHADALGAAAKSSRRDPSPEDTAARRSHPEAALGGADAIQKTTYVVGEGTEPQARPRGEHIARAAGGSNVIAWVVGGIAALVALVYAIGIFN